MIAIVEMIYGVSLLEIIAKNNFQERDSPLPLQHIKSIYWLIDLFIQLFIYSFIYLFIYLFIYVFIYLFVYLFIYLFIFFLFFFLNTLLLFISYIKSYRGGALDNFWLQILNVMICVLLLWYFWLWFQRFQGMVLISTRYISYPTYCFALDTHFCITFKYKATICLFNTLKLFCFRECWP